MQLKMIAIIIAAILVLIVLVQNTYNVNIHFLFWQISMPQVVLIFISVVLGVILGYGASLISKR